MKRSEAVGDNATSKAGASAGGGLGSIVEGQAHFEDQNSTERMEGAERVYDPLWTNALTLLNLLEKRDLVVRDLDRARIGQFALATGALSVVDLALFKGVWELDELRELVTSELASEPAGAEQRADGMLALMSMIPHTIQAWLSSENGLVVWTSLREDGLSRVGCST